MRCLARAGVGVAAAIAMAGLEVSGREKAVAALSGPEVTLIGKASIPGSATDLSGFTGNATKLCPENRLGSFGSGIDYTGKGNDFIAVDDRGPSDGEGLFVCRFHHFDIEVDESAGAATPVKASLTSTVVFSHGGLGFYFTGDATNLNDIKSGTAKPLILHQRLDPEGIRQLGNGNVLVSDEYGPVVLEFDAAGRLKAPWPVPAAFICDHPAMTEADELPPTNTKGRQPNRGLEGLALTPSGQAWTILQSPLIQDGGSKKGKSRNGSNIRLVHLGNSADAPPEKIQQFVYHLDSPENGINEMLAMGENEFLVIERDGKEAKTRKLYLINTTGATDVASRDTLPESDLPPDIVPVAKTLFLDFMDPKFGLGNAMPEKIEGLAWGPALKDGRKMLVVTTDNDMKEEEPSWFWVFGVQEK